MSKAQPPTRGIFITVEGIDGAGKTTLAHTLAEWLRERGHEVVLTREPGATQLGEKLRTLLLGGEIKVNPAGELLLYVADRAQHVAEVIRPALGAGRTVVCERFTDSTAAYQGYGRGVELELVHRLNHFATGGLEAHLTVLLRTPLEVARQRLQATPDRLEREEPAFYQRVAAGYEELARAHRERIKMVDGAAAPDQVFRQAAQVVQTLVAG